MYVSLRRWVQRFFKMAPFDKIIVTCGAPFIPEDLLAQLKVGGRLVIPLGKGDVQKMTMLIRTSETKFEKSTHGDFSFVPMLPKEPIGFLTFVFQI